MHAIGKHRWLCREDSSIAAAVECCSGYLHGLPVVVLQLSSRCTRNIKNRHIHLVGMHLVTGRPFARNFQSCIEDMGLIQAASLPVEQTERACCPQWGTDKHWEAFILQVQDDCSVLSPDTGIPCRQCQLLMVFSC